MDEIKLKKVFDDLSSIVEITPQQKQRMIVKYSSMSEKDVIKDLSVVAYPLFDGDDLDRALEVIRAINPTLCPSVTEMRSKLQSLFSNNIDGNMPIEENHALVRDTLVKVCSLFNAQEIDYYIVGALPCFLKAFYSLFRYHDDIDIMVNEDDIPRVEEIVTALGYDFQDDRFPSFERLQEMIQTKPPHTVLAQNPNNEFHLGFFCFRREQDNSITMREYSHRVENGEVIVDVLERKSTPLGTSLRYDEVPTAFEGITFKTSTIESVYNLKSYTKRPKDIEDMKRLEPYVDQERLNLLRQNPSKDETIPNVKRESHHFGF